MYAHLTTGGVGLFGDGMSLPGFQRIEGPNGKVSISFGLIHGLFGWLLLLLLWGCFANQLQGGGGVGVGVGGDGQHVWRLKGSS